MSNETEWVEFKCNNKQPQMIGEYISALKDYKGKSSDSEVQFKGLIADFYVKDQSVKVKAAVSARRGKGEDCCGSAPYGY